MTALVDYAKVVRALDWELEPAEVEDAEQQAEYLSNVARINGRPWPESAPPIVVNTIEAALKRYLRNAYGLTQTRAGDETMGWDGIGDKAGAPYFTDAELKVIRLCSGQNGFSSVLVNAWGTSGNRLPQGHVPVADGSKPFPLFPSDEGPW